MSASNAFETSMLGLIFNATAITDLAVNATTSPATELYVSLHTADPGETGTQSSSAATYAGYARVPVARSNVGWTILNNTVTNAIQINFPVATGGSSNVTHFGIGLASGTLLFSGALISPLAVSNGITPSFDIGDLSVTCD